MALNFIEAMRAAAELAKEDQALAENPPMVVTINGPLNAKAMAAIKELSDQVVHLEPALDTGPKFTSIDHGPSGVLAYSTKWKVEDMIDVAFKLLHKAGINVKDLKMIMEQDHHQFETLGGGQHHLSGNVSYVIEAKFIPKDKTAAYHFNQWNADVGYDVVKKLGGY